MHRHRESADSRGNKARFQCGPCGHDGHAVWAGELVCPRCGGREGVRVAFSVEEMTDQQVERLEQALVAAQDDDRGR